MACTNLGERRREFNCGTVQKASRPRARAADLPERTAQRDRRLVDEPDSP
jgi:hypothetical protein